MQWNVENFCVVEEQQPNAIRRCIWQRAKHVYLKFNVVRDSCLIIWLLRVTVPTM